MLAPDQLLQERYRIVRQLGHGGMGAVYEAIDERFGTPVALKEILIELSDAANDKQKDLMVRAFEREAKSLAQARHEAIPYVRDYFSELKRQFLVMELIEGDDLAGLLEKRGKPFPLETAVNWAEQLLDALDYLHNLTPSIVHRDIKPQNLKLNFRRKIKLLDFGIAKSGDVSSSITSQTFVGATLNYSPIEQILRVIDPTFREFIKLKHSAKAEKVLSQNTDARCDIYALGATFYHLLTNRLPIDSTKRTLEVWEGKADPLTNPSTLNPDIPLQISACLLKAMEIERDNRFSSAVEMQFALQSPAAPDSAAEVRRASNVPSSVAAPNAKSSSVEVSAVESSPVKIPDTQPSGTSLTPGSVETARLAQPPVYKKPENSGSPPIFEEKAGAKSNAKLLWALPIAVLSIFAIGGIGGAVWWSGSNLTNSTKPAVNGAISTPTAATITPSVSPSAPPLSPPRNSAVEVDPKNKTNGSSPNKTPAQNSVKTPTQKTPKSKLPPKNTGDDCIYNGKCN